MKSALPFVISPVADAYALEASTSLGGPWTPVSQTVSRSEFTDSVLIPFGGDPKKFFRLRPMSVTK